MTITNATEAFAHTPPAPSSYSHLSGTAQPLVDKLPPQDDLMGRVVQGAHDTIDRLAEKAAPPLAQLSESLSHAGESMQGKADAWRATGDEWAESLRGTVRENPLAALAAAVAVGVLVARLSR